MKFFMKSTTIINEEKTYCDLKESFRINAKLKEWDLMKILHKMKE